ncbi:MAG: phage portal protein [Clostridiales bacterium]|nr:phage portal protein [Clostridiales bacterium]
MGVFESWFGRFFKSAKFRFVRSFGGHSTGYDRDAYEHETVRSIIDAIASHTAKAQAMHVVVDEKGRIKKIKRNSPFSKLLNLQANELMSAYDLKYKLVTQVENYTTAMLYVAWDGDMPTAMYPINYRQYEFIQLDEGDWAVRFVDAMGDEYALPLEDVVVLRKFYNTLDIAGEGNGPVYGVLDLIKVGEEGMSSALRVANKIRGLLKQKNARLDDEDVQSQARKFEENMKKAAEEGGVVGVDLADEYVPITTRAYSLDSAQMKDIRDGLYRYWRTSENIIKSDYTESQWQAWYESVIEPRLTQMGQALTNVCFSQTERDHGNRILFYSSPLLHASVQTKINIVRASREIGLLTTNELRELFGYAPVEDGDVRQISLNYTKDSNQDAYQLGDTGEEDTNDQNQ